MLLPCSDQYVFRAFPSRTGNNRSQKDLLEWEGWRHREKKRLRVPESIRIHWL